MFDPSRNSASASDGSTVRAAANGAGCGIVAGIPVGEGPPHIGMFGIGGVVAVLCCAGVP